MDEKNTGSTYALLIGVDDYASFDGTRQWNLRGSTPSVVSLAWSLSEHGVLGVSDDAIRVLAWPRPSADEILHDDAVSWLSHLPATSLGQADEAGVRDGLEWLIDKARQGARVIFGFVGHGSWSATEGPVLCLGGVREGLQEGVLPLRALRDRIATAGVRDKVIAWLDCCHVHASPTEGGTTVTALPGSPGTDDDTAFDVSDRVLLAARPSTPAYQMRLGRHAHGAMTFALVTAAERWRASNGNSHGSYDAIVQRANRVVAGLGVEQEVNLRTPREFAAGIGRSPFLGITPGPTVATPDAFGRHAQLDPSWFYQIMVTAGGTSNVLAQVLPVTDTDTVPVKVISNDAKPYSLGEADAYQECWYLNAALSNALSALVSNPAGAAITISAMNVPQANPTISFTLNGAIAGGAPAFLAPEKRSWGNPSSSAKPYFFEGVDQKSGNALWLELDIDGVGSVGPTYTIVAIYWWLLQPTQPADGTLVKPAKGKTPGTFTYVVASAVPQPAWGGISLQPVTT